MKATSMDFFLGLVSPLITPTPLGDESSWKAFGRASSRRSTGCLSQAECFPGAQTHNKKAANYKREEKY